MEKYNNEVGIKYEMLKIDNNTYLLLPMNLVIGYSVGNIFYSNRQYTILKDLSDIKGNGTIVDNVYTIDEIKTKYHYFDGENEFVRDFFFEEEKNNIILVQIKNNKLIKRNLPIDMLKEENSKEIFQKIRDNIVVTLNMDSIDNLLNIEDITLLKKELENLKRKLLEFEKQSKKNTSKVVVENGHVREIEVNKKLEVVKETKGKSEVLPSSRDITLKGLESYIKERVFGHDDEIRRIAKTVIMNYTAKDNEEIEPILLVGPTGVGKTETMNAVAEYLGIPYVEVNTINLVPQGIKGESIEDYLYSLIVGANYDLDLAQRGLIFFDEFDKLGSSNTDYKKNVKDILLTFIEGGKFTLDKLSDDYIFNTRYLNKVFAGCFKDAFAKNKSVGFGRDVAPSEMDLTDLLSDKDYYGKELVTRIRHIYLYNDLDRETKKRILLYSKLSKYLNNKLRYERQFGIKLEATDSYIDAILDKLDKNKQSIRELKNLVAATLEELEYELLTNDYRGSRVILTSDTVENGRCFKIV